MVHVLFVGFPVLIMMRSDEMSNKEIRKIFFRKLRICIDVARESKDTDFEKTLRLMRDMSVRIDMLVDLGVIDYGKSFQLDGIVRNMVMKNQGV